MAEKELVVFIILINIILFIFIIGVILFIYHYRKRKILYDKEMLSVRNEHTKAILNAKLESQAQTMISIGNDIHDSVGQKLTLASLYLHKVSAKKMEHLSKDNLVQINDIINESLIELRLLSRSLVNPIKAHIDLSELIKIDIRRIEGLNSVKINLNVEGEIFVMDDTTKNNLYRIVQEFIQNSIKHANCKMIFIDLLFNKPLYNICLSDNGKGFEFNEENQGIGLTNIKRRSEEINASMQLSSNPDTGTQLILTGECK